VEFSGIRNIRDHFEKIRGISEIRIIRDPYFEKIRGISEIRIIRDPDIFA